MTIPPAELRKVLDILSRAQVSLGEAYQVRVTLDALVALASGVTPIGAIPVPVTLDGPKEG
jgi:hypothetical protein